MADVRLTPKEEDGDLPAVCMCCGRPASTWVRRNFMLQKPEVYGPSVFQEVYAFRMLIATAQAPRLRLRTSFCRQHRNYWKLRAALHWGGAAGLLAVLFLGIALVIFLLAVVKVDAPWVSGVAIGPFLLYLIAWIVPDWWVQKHSIRAQLAPDGSDDVILHNVHPRYVEALEQQCGPSRRGRRSATDSSSLEALPADGRTTANRGEEAAIYQSIAAQLGKERSPRQIEAELIESGWNAETAQRFVARVLEEMPGVLRSRYTWILFASLGFFAIASLVALILTLILLNARHGFFGDATSQKVLPKLLALAVLVMLNLGYWSAVSIWKVWLARKLEKTRTSWLRANGIPIGPSAKAGSRSSARSFKADDSSALARSAIETRDKQQLQTFGALVGCSAVFLFVLGLCVILPIADRIMSSSDSGSRMGNKDDVSQKLPASAPLPAELRERPGVDLIALLDLKKDVVHGPWEVRNGTLYCTHGGFVPRVQFPYLPPTEYDFIVTWAGAERETGICLVMPRPQGGSFFWVAGGGGNGSEYGFWGKPWRKSQSPIKPGTIHTTKVEVRKHSVRGFADGKEMMHLDTDFHDLTADDWRKIHDVRFPALACDAPIAYYHVRIVDVTGQGKKAR